MSLLSRHSLWQRDWAARDCEQSWATRGLKTVAVLATLLASAVALALNGADPDLWGHVQYGRDALEHGLPATSTYTYTAVGHRWINHENLAELGLAAGMDWLGPAGMLTAKCLLGVGVIGLIMWNGRRQGGSVLAVCVVSLLTAANLAFFWTLRPQVLSCVSIALLLTLLSHCFDGWAGRCHPSWLDRQRDDEPATDSSLRAARLHWLWLAPLLVAFWTNSHGGFVAGVCILTAYLVGRALELLLELPTVHAVVKALATLAGVLVASVAATLVNPYGFGLHAWLMRSLGSPRPEILEWRPPDLLSTTMTPFLLLIGMSVAALLLTRRSRDLTHTGILLLTLWQSLAHVRHIPFFAIAFAFWMVPHVDSVLARFRVHENLAEIWQRVIRRRAARVALAAVAVAGLLLMTSRLYGRLTELRVDRSQFPVAAVEFLARYEPRGRMIVTYNWAQYAIAAFGAEDESDGVRLSFDGRFRTCYPQDVVDMNLDFVLGPHEPRFRGPQSPPFDGERVLEFRDPNLVLLDRTQPHAVAVMQRRSDVWGLLYQDAIAQIWGRRSIYDNPLDPRFIAHDQRHISDDDQSSDDAWPALPSR